MNAFAPRQPPRPPPLPTRAALDTLLGAARSIARAPNGVEQVPTFDANGRVLARDIVAPFDVPAHPISAMDGYALASADAAHAGADRDGPRRFALTQRIAAGHAPQPLVAGSAARIFTGAMVPDGADTVVMQEQVRVAEANPGADGAAGVPTITLLHDPKAGEWINQRGADIRAGAVILAAGTRLDAAALGLAASVGCACLPVVRRLKVAVFFTGDELTMPGEPLKPGAIYNSSRFTLRALLANLGCSVTDYGIVADNLDATRATLRGAALDHDLVLTSGGVSVGDEDHVKPAVAAEGRLDVWQIAMKPGKPLAFGELRRGAAFDTARPVFFLGLPGNPVSSFVTFLIFVRPFLLRCAGAAHVEPRALTIRADFSQDKGDPRNEFLRARVNAAGGLEVFGNQSSAVLTSLVWGDGLIDNPPAHAIAQGELVRFLPFADLLY